MPETSHAVWLRELPEPELAALLQVRRDVLLHRPPVSLAELAGLLGAPWTVEAGLRQLDRGTVQVLGVAAAAGQTTERAVAAALSRTAPVTVAQVQQAYRRAAAVGLAWESGGGWSLAGGLVHLADQLLGLGPRAEDVLRGAPLAEIRPRLVHLGLPPVRSAVEGAALVAGHLADPKQVLSLLDAGSARELAERLDADPGLAGEAGEQERHLSRSGVLLADEYGGMRLVREASTALRGDRLVAVVEQEPVAALGDADQGGVNAAAAATAVGLVDDVARLLAVYEASPPAALKTGGLGVREVRRTAKALDQPVQRVVLLLEVAGSAGLLATWSDAGALTPKVDTWRASDTAERTVTLLSAVLTAGSALLLQPAAGPPLAGPHQVAGHTPEHRRRLLAGLDRHGPHPGSAASREQPASLVDWLDWSRYDRSGSAVRQTRWQLELDLLCTVGLVDRTAGGCAAPGWTAPLLADEPERATAVLDAALPPAQEHAVLQADGTAFVSGTPSAGLRRLLDLVAAREGERVWRVSAERLRDALDAGHVGEQLLADLHARSQHTLPQTVAQLVLDAAARHGRIRVGVAATWLHVPDEPLRVGLLHDRSLAGLGLVEVVPGVLTSGHPPALVLAALRKAGHSPAAEGAARPTPARRPALPPRAPVRQQDLLVLAHRLRSTTVESPHAPMPRPGAGRFDHLPLDQRLLLARALTDGRPVEIDYRAASGRLTTRVVEELADVDGRLEGYCCLRDDDRVFSPSGVLAVRPADDD